METIFQGHTKIALIVKGIRDLWIRGRDVAESFFTRILKKKRPRKASFYILHQKR